MPEELEIEEEYRHIPLQIEKFIEDELEKVRKSIDHMDFQERVIPAITQWMADIYIDKNHTERIISHFENVKFSVEAMLERAYGGAPLSYAPKSDVQMAIPSDNFYELCELIEPRMTAGSVWGTIDDKTNLQINFTAKQICVVKKSGGKHPHDEFIPVVEAVPSELVVYDTYLLDQPRTFQIKWKSSITDRVFTTAGESNGATINEIEEYLTKAGFVSNRRLLGDVITCTINTMIREGNAEIKTEIENPGFFYDTNKEIINVVKKDIQAPSKEELRHAVDTLAELKTWYPNNLDTLATIFKWGCMSAFSYAMKQAGRWMPWLYLRGAAGSGKTTLAKIALFIWDKPTVDNSLGGSSFDTEARIGANLSRSCDPIVVNEPASTFMRSRTREVVKVSIESTVSRSKYKNGFYGGIPAFAPVIFTANQYVTDDDALLRRLITLSFTHSDRKVDQNDKGFERRFQIDTPANSPLMAFNAFGKYVANMMVEIPGLVMDDWQQTIDAILDKLYADLDMEKPLWLKKWAKSETLEDYDENVREEIREFFIETINQAKRQIKIIGDSGVAGEENTLDIYDAATSEDFEFVTWNIIQQQQKGWYGPHVGRDGTKYVIFRQGLRKSLAVAIEYDSNLKGIAEVLGWEYSVIKLNGNTSRVMKVEFDKFMKFLYPDIESA